MLMLGADRMVDTGMRPSDASGLYDPGPLRGLPNSFALYRDPNENTGAVRLLDVSCVPNDCVVPYCPGATPL